MKRRYLFVLILIPLVFELKAQRDSIIHNTSQTDSVSANMLIINSFDAMSSKARNNKKELFRELADSLKQILYEATPPPHGGKLIVIPELISDSAVSDSIIHSAMLQNNASKAIVIKNLDAYFNQTDVKVTKQEDGKNRTAYYDICSTITYCLYYIDTKGKDAKITSCEFFTQRNVMSGLFAAGPDIVGKKKHAFKIVRKNALDYLSQETFWK